MLKPDSFFDLSKSKFSDLFDDTDLVWDALKKLSGYIKTNLKPSIKGNISPLAHVEENVYIGSGTVVEAGAVIKAPTIIGENCQIRAGAYVRGNVLIGDRVIIGHGSEFKNSIVFNEAEIPHFSYVGDSILGWKSHLGAGVKISNLKVNRTPVTVTIDSKRYETGLIKFGAIIADQVEIGCNCVLNPGTLIGMRSLIYANSIIKLRQSLEIVERKS